MAEPTPSTPAAPSISFPRCAGIREHLVVAFIAAPWGLAGRLVLDAVQRQMGFGFDAPTPMLSDIVGPLPLWALLAVAVWTPLTRRLSTSTTRQAIRVGILVTLTGTFLVYVFFMAKVSPSPTVVDVVGSIAMFPIFILVAMAFGGFVTIPIILASAVALSRMLHFMVRHN